MAITTASLTEMDISGLVIVAVLVSCIPALNPALTVTGMVTVIAVIGLMVTLLAMVGKLKAEVAKIVPGWNGSRVTCPAKVRLIGRVSEMSKLVVLKLPLLLMDKV